jgi:hypothetical protein
LSKQNELPSRLSTLAATTAAATAVTATTAAATAAESTTLRARARFVDVDRATVQLVAVELLYGLSRSVAVHLDERESARAASIPVGYDCSRLYLSGLRKQIGKLILSRLVRQVSNKYSHRFS